MKNTLFISVFAALMTSALSACGGKDSKAKEDNVPADSMAYSIVKKEKGDSTQIGRAHV